MNRPNTSTDVSFLPFAADSTVRRVHAEGVLLLGGGRALLMQIAHPAVARGVAEHSSFRGRRLERLLRTLRPTLAIVFGTREQALAAAAGINRLHENVVGAGYSARDPDLLLWVHATLIDTALVMHERFIRPLTAAEAEAYYGDMRLIGGLLGIPQDAFPPDVTSLRAYVVEMCASLSVSSEAREIAGALFAANPATLPMMAALRALTAGLLRPPLCAGFGLSWGPMRERALEAVATASRAVLPRTSRRLRRPPWFLMPSTHE